MAFCAKCGSQYDEAEGGCPACAGVPVEPRAAVPGALPAKTSARMPDLRKVVGTLGTALMIVGALLPGATASWQGQPPYPDIALGLKFEGQAILVLCLGALVLVYLRKYRFLLVPGAAAAAVAVGYYRLWSSMIPLIERAQQSVGTSPALGFWLILAGAALLLVAGSLPERTSRLQS